MNRKIRLYLYILGILWLGAAAQAAVSASDGLKEKSIEAILMEQDYKGQLTKMQLEALATEAFAGQKAEPVERLADGGVFSAYGYSPLLQGYVAIGGKRINLNLVASYNEEKDTTKVILASPIYNEDY